MNKVILLGRLVRDPSLKFGDNGKAVCKFFIAVDKPYKADRAEGEVTANFLPCAVFGSKGEAVAKYFKQGDRIAVQGRINTSSYIDENDKKRYIFDVIVDDFEFCQNKKNSAEGFHQAEDDGEDLPF